MVRLVDVVVVVVVRLVVGLVVVFVIGSVVVVVRLVVGLVVVSVIGFVVVVVRLVVVRFAVVRFGVVVVVVVVVVRLVVGLVVVFVIGFVVVVVRLVVVGFAVVRFVVVVVVVVRFGVDRTVEGCVFFDVDLRVVVMGGLVVLSSSLVVLSLKDGDGLVEEEGIVLKECGGCGERITCIGKGSNEGEVVVLVGGIVVGDDGESMPLRVGT